jgi:hypothetical protein
MRATIEHRVISQLAGDDPSETMPVVADDLAGNATLPATGNIAIASATTKDNVMRPMRMAVVCDRLSPSRL